MEDNHPAPPSSTAGAASGWAPAPGEPEANSQEGMQGGPQGSPGTTTGRRGGVPGSIAQHRAAPAASTMGAADAAGGALADGGSAQLWLDAHAAGAPAGGHGDPEGVAQGWGQTGRAAAAAEEPASEEFDDLLATLMHG